MLDKCRLRTDCEPGCGAYHAIGSTPWAFAGVLAVLSSAMILSYYNIVAGWALGYVVDRSFWG
jgi:NSS family neurotransmitter:Na+ symporter